MAGTATQAGAGGKNRTKTIKITVKKSDGWVLCDVCNEYTLYENTGIRETLIEIEEQCIPFKCRLCKIETTYLQRIESLEGATTDMGKELERLQEQLNLKEEAIGNFNELIASFLPDEQS